MIDESLNRDMDMVMKLVSLGHSARQKANRKVRQPLAEVAFSLGNANERKAVETYADLFTDELNVKQVRLLDAATEAVSHTVKPLPKQLGTKIWEQIPGDPEGDPCDEFGRCGASVVGRQAFACGSQWRDVRCAARRSGSEGAGKEGFAVAEDGPYVAALVTELTLNLCRKVWRANLSAACRTCARAADLDVADRIELFVEASAGLRSAVEAHQEYITAETLTSNLVFGSPPE